MDYDLSKEVVWQVYGIAQAVLIMWVIFRIAKVEEQIEKVAPLKKSNISTYKKKMEIFEVLKYEGVSVGEAVKFCNNKAHIDVNANLYIHTPERNIRVWLGDYIIKDEQDEITLCKADKFEEIYELVEGVI